MPEQHSLPPGWAEFLQEVDERLDRSVELHVIGGLVLAAGYGLPRPTGDLDYIAVVPSDAIADLERIAGRGSPLVKRYGFYFQYVTVADVPENYAERLTELFPGQLSRLRLLALEVHDLVLAKLVRNSPIDLEDAKFLARTRRRQCSRNAMRRNCVPISRMRGGTILRSSSGLKPAFTPERRILRFVVDAHLPSTLLFFSILS